MSDLIDFQIEVTVDPSAFMSQIIQKAMVATQAGAVVLEKEHERITKDWEPDAQPILEIGNAIVDGATIMRTLSAHGPIWWYINNGTRAIDIHIADHNMIFPFQGRGVSYSAKTDTPPGIGGREGRLGSYIWTHNVRSRSIRARNLIKRARDAVEGDVISAMQAAVR